MPTRELSILGLTFEIDAPFAEGQVINAAEAHALNQTRAENISNLVRKKLAELRGEAWNDASIAAAGELVAKVNEKYEFGVRQSGGPRATAASPLERECIAIAKAVLAEKMKAKGEKPSDYTKEAIAEAISALAENPKIVAMAKKRIEERAKLAETV